MQMPRVIQPICYCGLICVFTACMSAKTAAPTDAEENEPLPERDTTTIEEAPAGSDTDSADEVDRDEDTGEPETEPDTNVDTEERESDFNTGEQETDRDTGEQASEQDTDVAEIDTGDVTILQECYPGSFTIQDEADLRVFERYSCSEGTLIISAASLETVDLPLLSRVGGLTVTDNEQLTRVNFPELTNINGFMIIAGNAALATLDGFDRLAYISQGFSITDNPVLTSLEGLSSVREVAYYEDPKWGVSQDSLWIHDNYALPQCQVCAIIDQLETLPGRAHVWPNQRDDCDTDCGTGDGATCFVGNVTITETADIEALMPYACLTGDLTIRSTSLERVELPYLETVGGDVIIGAGQTSPDGNAALESLEGLSALTHVGGGVRIEKNPQLTSLRGLTSLETVTDYLYINDNERLASIEGLSGLISVGGNLDIGGNPILPQCQACALSDQLETLGGDTIFLRNLDDGCSDSCD